MSVEAISVGDYPRIGDSKEYQILRNALHKYDKNEITKEELELVRDAVAKQIIEEQQLYLDVVTDGQIYWEDPISHAFRNFHNVEISSLEIFFKTNRLYRKPKVTGEIKLIQNFLVKELEVAKKYAKKPLRIVITGPYTLAKHCETKNFNKTLEEITLALNEELELLNDYSINEIQIDEPSFSEQKPDWNNYKNILYALKKGVNHEFALNPYWTNISEDIEELEHLPIQTIHYDLANFSFDEKLLEWPRSVVLGVLNAEKTKKEDTEKIKSVSKRFLEKYENIKISSNTGLRYLPRNKAIEKLQLLNTLKKMEEER